MEVDSTEVGPTVICRYVLSPAHDGKVTNRSSYSPSALSGSNSAKSRASLICTVVDRDDGPVGSGVGRVFAGARRVRDARFSVGSLGRSGSRTRSTMLMRSVSRCACRPRTLLVQRESESEPEYESELELELESGAKMRASWSNPPTPE